jgi:hypothetical protein
MSTAPLAAAGFGENSATPKVATNETNIRNP